MVSCKLALSKAVIGLPVQTNTSNSFNESLRTNDVESKSWLDANAVKSILSFSDEILSKANDDQIKSNVSSAFACNNASDNHSIVLMLALIISVSSYSFPAGKSGIIKPSVFSYSQP